MYELQNQNQLLFDLNHEGQGMNRRKDETFAEYVDRVKDSNLAKVSHDHGLVEFMPGLMEQRNVLLKTYGHTYYFSYTSGERKRKFAKSKEVYSEPKKTS